jgi:glutaminyl-peptide cyclotransferase
MKEEKVFKTPLAVGALFQQIQSRGNRSRGSLMLSLGLAAPLLFAACPKSDGPGSPRGGLSSKPQPTESAAPIPGAVAFNGERAMEHVKKQLEFGPRPPGSPELTRTRAYIIEQLKSYGLKVTTDEFRAATPHGEKTMVNITAELPGESRDVIILSSHYDTKYFKNMRFVGANDPGASVGTLVELARVVAATNPKPKFTYWFSFFDGEEAFCENWDDCSKPGAPDNTYGSRHFVDQLKKANELGRVRAMILLDMMGFKDLELGRDTLSTKWLQNIVWQTGRELGYAKVFVDREEGVGGDDHEPFLKAGIDSLDMIQLSSYEYWHTPEDTIDKVSPKSMKIVGDVILASLPKIEQYLANHPKS